MCSIQPSSSRQKSKSSARQPGPKNMDYDEFNALNHGLRSIWGKQNPGTKIGAGTDASAIHGRLGAQVALLQSPILPAVSLPYIKRGNFRGLPVDKPHTSIPRLLVALIAASPGFAALCISRLTLFDALAHLLPFLACDRYVFRDRSCQIFPYLCLLSSFTSI